MAEHTLSFEIAGEEQLVRSFSRFGERMGDLREPFEDIADNFKEIESGQFETQGGRGSGGWKPLNPEYAAWKEMHYPGKPIMVRTGRLKGSLLGGADSLRDIQAQQLTLGTKVPYALKHQKGAGRLPRRPLIELTEADKKQWTKTIHIWATKQVDESFRKGT